MCISGMYELAPVRLSKRSAYIAFDDATVEALSPLRHLDRLRAPLLSSPTAPARPPNSSARTANSPRRSPPPAKAGAVTGRRALQPFRIARDPRQSLRPAGAGGARTDGAEVMSAIDLRSDTVTRPSAGMRQAMAAAPVGDDQYGEDPSVNRLQERVAELLGKEAALFVPSGTMANQIGLKVLTRPGDEVVLGHEAHIVWHESGAGAANSGVQFAPVGQGGLFTAADLRAAYKPPGHIVFPPTTLVAVENTHNRGGGVVFPQQDAVAVCAAARELGMASYLDGARLFNAAAASGAASPNWPHPSISFRSRCRRASAARSAASSPAAGGRLPAPIARGACSAARCASPASSPPPGCGRSTTISTGSPRTTPTPGCWRNGWRDCAVSLLDLATVQSNIVIFHMAGAHPRRRDDRGARRGGRGAGLGFCRAHGPRRDPSRRQPRAMPACRRSSRPNHREAAAAVEE